ncbi:MAG: HAD family hydrolase [Pseudomonadota bacterium]
MIDLRRYKTLIFDCDGVVLNSNGLKTEAFRKAATPYGAAAAEALVAHHLAHGGVSRFRKFEHFLTAILGRNAPHDYDALLRAYGDALDDGLMSCEVAAGLEALRAATPTARWLIASGGAEEELREVFAKRGLSALSMVAFSEARRRSPRSWSARGAPAPSARRPSSSGTVDTITKRPSEPG